jgi:hypothetical protein
MATSLCTTVESFDPVSGKWEAMPEVNRPCASPLGASLSLSSRAGSHHLTCADDVAVTVHNGRLFVIGGMTA